MKRVFIFDPVYSARIWVLAPCKAADALRLAKRLAPKFKPDADDKEDDFYGCAWQFGRADGAKPRTFIVALKEWRRGNVADLATVVHECVHLTHAILGDSGMTLSNETEEAYAYLTDSLFHRIVTGLK